MGTTNQKEEKSDKLIDSSEFTEIPRNPPKSQRQTAILRWLDTRIKTVKHLPYNTRESTSDEEEPNRPPEKIPCKQNNLVDEHGHKKLTEIN